MTMVSELTINFITKYTYIVRSGIYNPHECYMEYHHFLGTPNQQIQVMFVGL